MAQETFPSRTIRIVTPLAAGSAADIALRVLADRMSTRLRVPVVVENQPGAGGALAARPVITAPHDGYTIGWFGNNTAINVSLFAQPFDPRKDTKAIVGVAEFSYLFVTNASSKYQSLQDFIAAAREKPGALNIGTSSAGTSSHLTTLLFKTALNLDVGVVPYRGASELSVALLRSDVDLVINAYGGLREGINAGQIRALASTSATRVAELPAVPTMAEAGVADFEVYSWNALYASSRAPQATFDVIRQVATEVLAQEDVKAKYRDIGFVARALSPAEQEQRMQTEIDRWAAVIDKAGLKPQ